jgi:hypothetical protein
MTGPTASASVDDGRSAGARDPAGAVGPWLPGPVLFARFAFPPNRLGLCGPESGRALPEHVRSGRTDPALSEIARGFEGAYPYLELIASENRIADPLDARVVEAYWLGNDLLEHVGPRARYDDLTGRFRARTARREWPWLEAKADGASAVHHSFHVLEILPRIGMIRGGLPPDLTAVLERCLVRPGRVLAVDGDALDVELPNLAFRDGRLHLDPPRPTRLAWAAEETFGDVLLPGDDVAVHWDRVSGRLTPRQASRLSSVTRRNLAVANTTL